MAPKTKTPTTSKRISIPTTKAAASNEAKNKKQEANSIGDEPDVKIEYEKVSVCRA